MKNTLCFSVGLLVMGGALVSCGTQGTGAAASTSAGGQEAKLDISQAKVPVLKSTLEKSWGAPTASVDADGGYRLTYRQGETLNFVFVVGMVTPEPVPVTVPKWGEDSFNEATGYPTMIYHTQQWRQMQIMGKSVKWYQNDGGGGADFPCYKTVTFQLTAPDGRTGYYRVDACSTSAEQAGKWMKQVGW